MQRSRDECEPALSLPNPGGYIDDGNREPNMSRVTARSSYVTEFGEMVGFQTFYHAMGLSPEPQNLQQGLPMGLEVRPSDKVGVPCKVLRVPFVNLTKKSAADLCPGMYVGYGARAQADEPLVFDRMDGSAMRLRKPNGAILLLPMEVWTTDVYQCCAEFSTVWVKGAEESFDKARPVHAGGPAQIRMMTKTHEALLSLPVVLVKAFVDKYDRPAHEAMSAKLGVTLAGGDSVDFCHLTVLIPMMCDQRPGERAGATPADWRPYSELRPASFANEPSFIALDAAPMVTVERRLSHAALALGAASAHNYIAVDSPALKAVRKDFGLKFEQRVQGYTDAENRQLDVVTSPVTDSMFNGALLGIHFPLLKDKSVNVSIIVNQVTIVTAGARVQFYRKPEAAYHWLFCVRVGNNVIQAERRCDVALDIHAALQLCDVPNRDVIHEQVVKHMAKMRRRLRRQMTATQSADDKEVELERFLRKLKAQGLVDYITDPDLVPSWAKRKVQKPHKKRLTDEQESARENKRQKAVDALESRNAAITEQRALEETSVKGLLIALKNRLMSEAQSATTDFDPAPAARSLVHLFFSLGDPTQLTNWTGQEAAADPVVRPAPVLQLVAAHARRARVHPDLIELLQAASAAETPAGADDPSSVN